MGEIDDDLIFRFQKFSKEISNSILDSNESKNLIYSILNELKLENISPLKKLNSINAVILDKVTSNKRVNEISFLSSDKDSLQLRKCVLEINWLVVEIIFNLGCFNKEKILGNMPLPRSVINWLKVLFKDSCYQHAITSFEKLGSLTDEPFHPWVYDVDPPEVLYDIEYQIFSILKYFDEEQSPTLEKVYNNWSKIIENGQVHYQSQITDLVLDIKKIPKLTYNQLGIDREKIFEISCINNLKASSEINVIINCKAEEIIDLISSRRLPCVIAYQSKSNDLIQQIWLQEKSGNFFEIVASNFDNRHECLIFFKKLLLNTFKNSSKFDFSVRQHGYKGSSYVRAAEIVKKVRPFLKSYLDGSFIKNVLSAQVQNDFRAPVYQYNLNCSIVLIKEM